MIWLTLSLSYLTYGGYYCRYAEPHDKKCLLKVPYIHCNQALHLSYCITKPLGFVQVTQNCCEDVSVS